ncbi:MAG: cyclic pyranopterin monophosphate synthase MoaC [Verrucomicrobiales bacterium]|nr:cyclic pyranopterin monophosphate synthase MoaC [Verrucomicrobiales bacterium]
MPDQLTHLSHDGTANMVDVGAKPPVAREAVATGTISLAAETLTLIQDNALKKGDVLAVARIAGIQAAKQTQLLIPLCHQIPLTKVAVDFTFEPGAIRATTTSKTIARTGVEMEALTAASVALLTIYDMCKAVDKTMRLEGIHLLSKTKSPA